MSAAIERLQSEVTETVGAINSAIALINGLAARLREVATDAVAVNALADELDAKSNELAAAVTANQPTV